MARYPLAAVVILIAILASSRPAIVGGLAVLSEAEVTRDLRRVEGQAAWQSLPNLSAVPRRPTPRSPNFPCPSAACS